MKDKILHLIETCNPKSVSSIIKQDTDLKEWVVANSPYSENFSKRIYDSLYPNHNV